jgi:DNA processing protein
VLSSLPSLTPRALLELAERCSSASACVEAVLSGEAASVTDRQRARSIEPSAVSAALTAVGARMVAVGDPAYPTNLFDLADPPAVLFVRGRWPIEGIDAGDDGPGVAIVGSRTCSPAGAETAGLLASTVATTGSCVVSGGARGIDAAAHRGALDAAGATVAVLGCGIDILYPRSNRELFERLVREAAVVSEYPPGTPPEPFRFPARNRIVAALAVAVIVVEGATGSGSMITAELALDMGREVLAVPGPITSDLSDVPHRLIRDGATLVRGPDDVVLDLGLRSRDGEVSAAPDSPGQPRSLHRAVHGMPGRDPVDPASRVYDAIVGRTSLDQLCAALDLPPHRVSGLLAELELRGSIRSVGGRYERTLTSRPDGSVTARG